MSGSTKASSTGRSAEVDPATGGIYTDTIADGNGMMLRYGKNRPPAARVRPPASMDWRLRLTGPASRRRPMPHGPPRPLTDTRSRFRGLRL